MQALELGFCFAQIAGIGDGSTVAIGVEGFEAHIDAGLLAGGGMLNLALGFHGKLDIIAIRPLEETNALDLPNGIGFDGPLLADQAQCADAHAIREGDMLSVAVQLPTRCFVLYRAVVFLETGIAFCLPPPRSLGARLLLTAVFIEAGDGLPGTVSTGLTRHRIEPGGKRVVLGKLSAEGLHLVLAHAPRIHPQPDGLIADELDDADGFVNLSLLALIGSQLVFQNQHRIPACAQHSESATPARRFARCHLLLPTVPEVSWPVLLIESVFPVSCPNCSTERDRLSSGRAIHPRLESAGLSGPSL